MFSSDRHARRPDLHGSGRAADDRRPHPDRRQHAHRPARDPQRDEAQARRSRSAARIATRASARLSALGLFRRVRITELRHGSGDAAGRARHRRRSADDHDQLRRRPRGEPAAARDRARAVRRSEQLEFAPRGFFNIGRRNVGGRNRTVDLYTRVSLRPQDGPDDPAQDGSGLGFIEYRVVGTLCAQPRALLSSDVVVTAAIEQGVRTSFNFARKGVNADMLRRLTPSIRGFGALLVQHDAHVRRTADEEEQATIDRIFPQVRLSTFSGALATRHAATTSRSASRRLPERARGPWPPGADGGQVGFLKTYLQGSWFRQLPGRRPIVFATRGAIGLADGFARDCQQDRCGRERDQRSSLPGNPATLRDRRPARERALLRRRRHDHPRLRARYRRHAGDDQRQRLPARRERGGDHERRAARAGVAGVRRGVLRRRRQRLRPRRPTSILASCAARWGSACATARRSGRSASTSASSSIAARWAASSSRARSGT